jgi:pyridoxal phosphate enzyme (YggS family)
MTTPCAQLNAKRLAENVLSVRDRIARAASQAGRAADEVTLVAVTKKSPLDAVRALVEQGEEDLGENYPQELWTRAEALADLPIRWHHIGHLQGNKARRTLPLVRMIHGVDSLKLLLALDELSDTLGLVDPPAVCLQVNTSSEPSKQGWTADSLLSDSSAIAGVRQIPVVGLMTMAPLGTEGEAARPYFSRLRDLRDDLSRAMDRSLPHLSMGMSGDFEAAIKEGATLVRVGSALFEGVGQ